jgi:hypothetical protein
MENNKADKNWKRQILSLLVRADPLLLGSSLYSFFSMVVNQGNGSSTVLAVGFHVCLDP